ncbi:MAG: hypothetical protein JRF33_04555 [Deltaproteobacteria bacterium]|nr:hypothetical protein [Deltaproteobacteria bacterium]
MENEIQVEEETKPSKTKQLIGVIVVIGLLATVYGLQQLSKVSGIQDREKAFGKVIISKVLPHKRAQIIYKYQDPKYRNLQHYSCSIMPGQNSIRISGSPIGRSTVLESCKEHAIGFESKEEAKRWVDRFPVDKGVEIYWTKKSTYLDHRPQHDAWLPWVIGGGLVMLAGILALLLIARLKKNAEDERAAKKTE